MLFDAPLFHDRLDAGRALAALLPELGQQTLVVGLARGGVVVAAEVAVERGWPLDVVAVHKVRHPHQPEYALGAVAPDGDGVYLRARDGLTEAQVADAVAEAQRAAAQLDRRLHAARAPLDREGRQVVLVDDGVATGATMIAAARWAAAGGASSTIAAVPICARQSVRALLDEVDLLFCPHVRDDVYAIGLWYADFTQVTDAEVERALAGAALHT